MSKMPRQLWEEAARKLSNINELMSGRLNGKNVWAPLANGKWHRCALHGGILMPRCNFSLVPVAEEAIEWKPKGVTFCQRIECK